MALSKGRVWGSREWHKLGVILGLVALGLLSACGTITPFGTPTSTCTPVSLGGVTEPICYQIVDGRMIFQGDIVIGYADDEGGARRALLSNASYLGTYRRWDNAVVPYLIDPALPNPSRVTDAIAHYHSRTAIRLVPRTNQPDYVMFRHKPGDACYSNIGRVGGQQFIDLDTNCGVGPTIHEIGHAIGLWHEQGRADRDANVIIHLQNVRPGFESAFAQNLQYTQDYGPYDFYSIMHYLPTSFSANGQPTITRKDGSISLGQQSQLTAGDTDAIAWLYGPGSLPPSSQLNLVGVPHAVAAAPASGSGRVQVWDAANQQLKGYADPYPGFAGGISVALGDVNGDGTLDVATAAGQGGGPRVTLFDGRNGAILRDFFPYEESFRGGVFVALGDVNGDGADDVITGTGVGGGPRVTVFDGRSHAKLADFFAYEASFRGGVLVAAADVDGDRRAEIITGTGPGGGPRVRVMRLNGTPVHDFFAYESSFRGGVKVGGGDLDGDGIGDVLSGTGAGGGPRVTARNGRNLGFIGDFFADDPSSRAGVNVAATLFGGRPAFVSGAGPGGAAVVRVHDLGGHLLWQAGVGSGNGANVAGR